MSVHYKFKSNLDHDTVTFDGLSISVADLKKSIMQQKKIGKSSDFDLQITNAQTKEVYDSDDMLVPKNTSVIVARVPAAVGSKNKNWDKPDLPLPIDDDDLGKIRYDRIVKNADLANANTSEEDKVKAMITQSSQEYDPSKFVKSRSMTGPLPPTYTCFRCGKQGHWIKNCPTNNPDVKRSTGIPRSFMVPVDGPEHKGALLTSSGEFAVPLIDHQAYKEVKKEKPPFVPQDEPIAEPEAEIPEELLCMVCKDLLQDAVLIPCCGNSFCDECIRQVLIESDNHECPECHETEVSPNTLIPNRFLRTAVLNFRNETGYTRAMRMNMSKSSPLPIEKPDSPQPSPDSTVESHPQHSENTSASSQNDRKIKEEKTVSDTKPTSVIPEIKVEVSTGDAHGAIVTDRSPKSNQEEDSRDAQPGTPLADELPVDMEHSSLPIQALGHENYHSSKYDYHSGSRYHRGYRDDYHDRYSGDEKSDPFEAKPISTIETITNMRKMKGRPVAVRQPFQTQRGGSHRDEREDDRYNRDRGEYHRYDRRHERPQRSGHSRYDRSPQSRYDDYHHPDDPPDGHYAEFDSEDPARRHQNRYRVATHPVHLPPAVPVFPPVAAIPLQPVMPAHPVFVPQPQPQPPPPGASPVDIAAQPPPPGVGPLLPTPTDTSMPFPKKQYETEDTHNDGKKIDDRSIDDKMEAFQRELEKRDREYSRERVSHSRSRSSGRDRSRSSSRSRSYSSSKSWSRSISRSSSRASRSRSRSRSRSPLSSRSRSRSYTPSRSRSWSKVRSYTRSRSRTRTESSRSRSRSWTDSRFRKRRSPRDRVRSPRPRSRSHSYSPKSYRPHPHRPPPYSSRHHSPPHHGYGASYQSQYPPPPAIGLPVLRPDYPHHVHPIHPAQTLHPRPVEHYPMDRQSKFAPYSDIYPSYDVYQHPRYEREQRQVRYDKRQEYQKDYPKDYQRNYPSRQYPEVVGHRIPGYIGDRSCDFKPRYRQGREPRKDIIRELPQIPEPEVRHSKEPVEEPPPKKREEKVVAKHKKHHHHHKSNKETKKIESRTSASSAEKVTESSNTKRSSKSENKVEKVVDEVKLSSESVTKVSRSVEKVKEKKHKHKKHKNLEQVVKKKKATKKEKGDVAQSTDSDAHVKVKNKKKKKLKAVENVPVESVETPAKEVPPVIEPTVEPAVVPETKPVEELETKSHDTSADTLDIFADEGEAAILSSEGAADVDLQEVPLDSDIVENELNVVEKMEEDEEEDISEVEDVVDENALHVDMPALSKWEREELEDDLESRPQRRNLAPVVKEEKESLPSDIIHRAELAILSKPLKPQVTSKEKGPKDSSTHSSPDVPVQSKEPELKSVVNTDSLSSPSLQVTITTTKEKRSVHPKKDDKKESSQSKRKSEKSSHKSEESSSRRVASAAKVAERPRDGRDRSEQQERRRSPARDLSSRQRNSSRDARERRDTRKLERTRYSDEQLREERRRRFAENRNAASSREADYPDRRRNASSHSHTTRPYEQYTMQPSERQRRSDGTRRSRSRTSSAGSQVSCKKKAQQHTSRRGERQEDKNADGRIKGKYSPVNPPSKHSSQADHSKKERKDYHDDTKFEPDYDDFSDVEEKESSRQKLKRKSASPGVRRKKARLEKVTDSSGKDSQKADKGSVTSSDSSSASDSDSSDSDDPKSSKSKDSDQKQKHKKTKHKKHKKHKHKHKKKKSHKSKRD